MSGSIGLPGHRALRQAAVFAALVVFAVLPALAAQLNMRHYDTRDGIPQIQVTSVHQDAEGYLWVGTYGGLARYNGESFEVFRGGSGLNTSYINVVDSGDDRVLWVGTSHGLCRSQDAGFECFNPDGVDQLMVNDLLIDGNVVWAAGDEGVFRWSPTEFERVPGWPQPGGSTTAHTLALDDRGVVWVGLRMASSDSVRTDRSAWRCRSTIRPSMI